MRKLKIPVILLIILLFYSGTASASTTVAGDVSGTWDLTGSPYILASDCNVQSGSVLTIEPGVEIILGENHSINVYGQILAVGTKENHITFKAPDQNTFWKQVYVSGTSVSPPISEFRYCDFSSAQKALSLHIQGYGSNVWTIMQVNISNCTFADSVDTAINGEAYARDFSQYMTPKRGHAKLNPVIENCIFNGTNEGINIYTRGVCNSWCSSAASDPIIRNCIFTDIEGSAFNASGDQGTPEFINNTIVRCNRGIMANNYDATVKNNIFYANETAVERTGSLSVSVYYNGFFNNTTDFVGYPDSYGEVIMENSNDTPCDAGFNIFVDPLFLDDLMFYVARSSPYVDAGDPDELYFDECSPPSRGTEINDLGALGGPGGCTWEEDVQEVAYVFIEATPVEYLKTYELSFHGITLNDFDVALNNISWSLSDPAIASLNGNLLTGAESTNGYAVVSTDYTDNTYNEIIYFKSSGDFESFTHNSPETADELTESIFMEGELLENEIDFYKFNSLQSDSFEIVYSSRSQTADVLIEIFDNSQTLVAFDRSQDGETVRLHIGTRPETYYIKLSYDGDVDDNETYDIVYVIVPEMIEVRFEAESNDTYKAGTLLSIDSPVKGKLATEADSDFYLINLEAPAYLDLMFECKGINQKKKFNVELYNDNDSTENLICEFTVFEGTPAEVSMGLAVGKYYIKVTGETGNTETNRPYNISIKPSIHTDIEIESNNTLLFANPIVAGETKTGTIYSNQDLDYYGFNVVEQGVVRAEFVPYTSTAADYTIALVSKSGEPLYTKASYNGEAKNLARELSPGIYYFMIASEQGGDIDPFHLYSFSFNPETTTSPITGLVSFSIIASSDHIEINEQINLSVRAYNSDASSNMLDVNQLFENVQFISQDPSVVSVDEYGKVTGHSDGCANINATYEGFVDHFSISVGQGCSTYKQHHGNLIILTGSGEGDSDPLSESAQYLSDLVYRHFQRRLFSDEDIYYFNPVSWHDIDGDGYSNDIVKDTNPTVTKFGQAITNWAAGQSTDGPLFIFLVGHGEIDAFSFSYETLTALQLKGFIDTFQNATGRQVIVIIEACKSGSFTDDLVSEGQNRIVVTSTDDQDAYLKMDGRISFTQFFIDKLFGGGSIYEGWQRGKSKLAEMELPFSQMNPQIAEGVDMASNRTWVGGEFVIASVFPGWIMGKVFDSMTGFALDNATVTVTGVGNFNTINGGYFLCEVPAGTYTISIDCAGYDPSNHAGIVINKGDSIIRNFGLAAGQRVAQPVFAPIAGNYISAQQIEITCSTEGAVIRYTTDGTDPNEVSTVYTSAIEIAETTIIKARAFRTGWAASGTTTGSYLLPEDTTPPVATISGIPYNITSSTSLILIIGGEDVIVFKYKLDDGEYGDEIAAGLPIALSGLIEGTHSVYVIGMDSAGNWQAEEDATSALWEIKFVGSGDINGDNMVDLKDGILLLQILCNLIPGQDVYTGAGVNGDRILGLEEAIYVLGEMAEE